MQQRSKELVWLVLLALVLGAQVMRAQAEPETPSREQADKFFQAQEWEKTARAYEEIAKREPSNGQAWFRLGVARHNLKQYARAIAAWEQAEKNGFTPARSRYNIASAYSLLGKKDEAFEWLDKAVQAGFSQVQTLKSNADLARLHDDPRFQQVVEQAQINAAPCEHLPVYGQFDFWVGEWDVFTPNGRQAGTNRIEKVTSGCILLEHWSGAGGGSGKSINFYDPGRKKWVQEWVDASAGVILTAGELKDGSMVLEGEHIYRNGRKELYRGTWTPQPDGTVRQLLEQSRDGGQTWYVWFDGKYVRKK